MNAVSAVPAEPPYLPVLPQPGLDGHDEAVALLADIAAGRQHALERFYKLTVGRVHGLALRITRRREMAEEVTEDVYMQVWRSAADFDGRRGAPLGWVLTICRSRAIDALRRSDGAICDPEPYDRVDAVVPHTPGLQDLLQATQQHAALHAAIARLRPLQRQLLSLAFFRGLTHEELAAHAGQPLGTVKSLLRRTLAQLRKELDAA